MNDPVLKLAFIKHDFILSFDFYPFSNISLHKIRLEVFVTKSKYL